MKHTNIKYMNIFSGETIKTYKMQKLILQVNHFRIDFGGVYANSC